MEAAFGQAKDYMDQYFAKASYAFPVAGNDLRTTYQFYGAKTKLMAARAMLMMSMMG